MSDRYLALIEELKEQSSVPVIASLNATTAGGWARHAALIEQAGADALELNLYHVAADPERRRRRHGVGRSRHRPRPSAARSASARGQVEPVLLGDGGLRRGVVDAGADGLVLFNRFYQPDLDLDSLEVVNRVELSHPGELRLPLRWIAILRPQLGPTSLSPRPQASTRVPTS